MFEAFAESVYKNAAHMHIKKVALLILFIYIAVLQSFAQKTGFPFIRNFPPQEYKTSPQNWSVVQDQHGLLYFGNNDGILEFDGNSWNLIKVPGVSTIAVDSIGYIYVGLDNDFGYIKPDDKGVFQYFSLKSLIPKEHQEINLCHRVHVVGKRVIFQTSDHIYIYDHKTIKCISSKERLSWSFVVNNRFYLPKRGLGMFTLQNDSLRLIRGGELLKDDPVASMMAYQKNEILITSLKRGILVFSQGNQPEINKPAGFENVDKFIQENIAYSSCQVSSGIYAIGTITGGVIVFTSKGEILNIYNKANGLQDNSVYWIYSDLNQQLWAALDNGISNIQSSIPFTQYNDKCGLNGGTMCMKFFDGRFYVGTNQDLYVQNQDGYFEPIEGTESQNFSLFEARGKLLLANLSAISEIKDKKALPLSNTSEIGALSFSFINDRQDILLVGALNGLYLLKYTGSNWTLSNYIKGFSKPAYKIDEDTDGNIWISTFLDLYKLKLNALHDSVVSVQLCTAGNGLPTNYAMSFRLNSKKIVFCTEKGVYDYKNDENRFMPDPDFCMLTGKVTQFIQIENGDIYYEQVLPDRSYEKGVLRFFNGKYDQNKTPFDKFRDISTGDCPYNICPAPDGTVFLGTGYGLLQYNPRARHDYNIPYNTLIRKVYANDSLMFGGENLNYPFALKIDGKAIPYSRNNLVFHFSSTSYEDPENNLFSYRLIGSEKSWSGWSTDSKKEYTNLPEGRYIFQVKSKNQYQVTGSIASYSFTILPPWYRTSYAIIMYLILFAIFLWFILKLYVRRLERQKANLENIITERTTQVTEQKKEIEENNEVLTKINNQLNESNKELNLANDKLRITLDVVKAQKGQIEAANRQITSQNMELHRYRDHLEQLVEERTRELLFAKNKAEESDRLKTAFLQNMSHEIRTPMNGILGFLELLKEPDLDEDNKNNYIDIINTSGQRLLTTINDIIEISRIESNQLAVNFSVFDSVKMMEYHYDFFKPQAEEKGLSLDLSAGLTGKEAIIESDKQILDNILINLINNAIKFTPKGTVEFGNYLENDRIIFFVRDTGVGIPFDRHDAIFERFVQADMKNTRTHEGSGLGLAIVKGYLELLEGKIWVDSEPGKGSAFYFSIPYKPAKKKSLNNSDKKEQEPVPNKRMTILIVEDDENSFLYLKGILNKVNADIWRVSNGNDAVRTVRENPGITLVLMDIKMPELNGFDATRQIREFNTTVPIIAQSAYAFSEEKEKAFEVGFNDYLTKPINSSELIRLVQKYSHQ
jgi:signal transduction histidine kinase/ligand-binding sensor domain-containing protein/ActR/RegA family two-component response regulator